jgi:uroporphyrinogen-III synthase
MIRHLLAVGPSIPAILHNQTNTKIIHDPLISLRAIPLTQKAIYNLAANEALLITSKHAADFYKKALGKVPTHHSRIFCVGKASSEISLKLFPESEILTATHEHQEGLIELIQQHTISSIAWPRSSKARPFLTEYLKKKSIACIDCSCYEPICLDKKLNLSNIERIFFSSPSCVEAFFLRHSLQDLHPQQIFAIGPITYKTLLQKGVSHERIYSCTSSIWDG